MINRCCYIVGVCVQASPYSCTHTHMHTHTHTHAHTHMHTQALEDVYLEVFVLGIYLSNVRQYKQVPPLQHVHYYLTTFYINEFLYDSEKTLICTS